MAERVQGFFYAVSQEFQLVHLLTERYERFELFDDQKTAENARKFKQLMTLLPNEDELDYLVYSASNSITEEPLIWNLRFHEVIKRMMFKKFDNWVESELMNG